MDSAFEWQREMDFREEQHERFSECPVEVIHVVFGMSVSRLLIPSVHRRGAHDVAQIAGAVARWNTHASAQRDGEVSEVPTNAAPLGIGIPCCLGRARMLVIERDAIRHNRRSPSPAANPSECARTGTTPHSIADRSRSSGCRGDRSGPPPATVPVHAARPAGI